MIEIYIGQIVLFIFLILSNVMQNRINKEQKERIETLESLSRTLFEEVGHLQDDVDTIENHLVL